MFVTNKDITKRDMKGYEKTKDFYGILVTNEKGILEEKKAKLNDRLSVKIASPGSDYTRDETVYDSYEG